MFKKKNKFGLSFVLGILTLTTILSFTGLVSAEDTESTISAEITMDANDLTTMNESTEGSTDLYTATIIIDGTTYENVGIRLASQSDMMEQRQQNSDSQLPQGQGGDGSGQQPPQEQSGQGGQGGQQPADGSGKTEKPEGEKMVAYLIQLDNTTTGLAYKEKTTIILSQMGGEMGTSGEGGQQPSQGQGGQGNQQVSQMPEVEDGQQPQGKTGTRVNLTINGTDAGEFMLM